MKELETIEYCFKEVAKNYWDELNEYIIKNKYLLLVSNLSKTLKNLFIDYTNECQNFLTTEELKIYEKAACLAMAIKNNTFYAISNQSEIIIDTSINASFAIDVALKFCENSLQVELFSNLNQDVIDYVQYTICLLVDILEYKNVQTYIISDSIKKQIELLANISKQKIKFK